MLGNGTALSAQDTVPYVLWCAAEQLYSHGHALWLTARGFGDVDTTCAMVGGIVELLGERGGASHSLETSEGTPAKLAVCRCLLSS